ncbi:MAG: tyrosinase family protein [Actinomycetota bacterium]|nr:tyrosinase family protein [Actinomycetota bacterium]
MTTGSPSNVFLGRPVRWRRNVELLEEGQLDRFRTAFQELVELRDENAFRVHAGIYGLPLPDYSRVAYGTPLFLPWHRAYLFKFQRALQSLGEEGVTLPWWNWTSPRSQAGELPDAFAQETVAGKPNALYSADVDDVALSQWRDAGGDPPYGSPTRRLPAQPGSPPLPSRERVADLLSVPDFARFSDQLETLHSDVLLWVGGDEGHMSHVAFAAYDPLFWAHLATVDRLWRLWQLRHGDSTVPRAILSRPLPPFELTVADVLDATALGYDYASVTGRVFVNP